MALPELYLDERGIIHELHDVAVVTPEVALYAASERERISSDEKRPLLVKFDHIFGFTEDTRDMDVDIILKNVKAIAYYVSGGSDISVSQKILIEGWFKTTPWPVPIKVFFVESDAIDWLLLQ